jgi:hypothetical protein
MLVLKRSVRERDYADRIGDDFRHAFDGRFYAEPHVIDRLVREWKRWERFASNQPGRECNSRYTLSDEGNFWMARFSKAVFGGYAGQQQLKGTWTHEIVVYRDCIASNGPIYKKMDANR